MQQIPVTEEDWYRFNNCTHAHCPDGCEHPQPIFRDGELRCGRCECRFGEKVLMLPCTPTVCD